MAAATKNKHVMLSYHWDNQDLVSKIYHHLKDVLSVPIWMDTYGGMGECLSVSMAEGVENSYAVVCFLTPGYQESINCKKELTYAVQLRKTIIPCLVGPSSKQAKGTDGKQEKWKPSRWLGLTITDLLYLNFTCVNDSNFLSKCQEIICRIQPLIEMPAPQPQPLPQATEIPTITNKEKEIEIEDEDFEIDAPLTIAPAIYEGPHLDDKSPPIVPKKYTSEGDSVIRLINQSKEIECSQDFRAIRGNFFNWFVIPRLAFHNTSSQSVTVLQLSAEYQATSNVDGKWTPCQLGDGDDGEMINIDPNKLVVRPIKIKIEVHGSPGIDNEHRRRAHNLLPQPLRLKLVIEDTQMQHASLIIEQVNPPLNLVTVDRLKTKLKIPDSNMLGFIWTDDCSIDVRYFIIIYYLCDDETLLKLSYGPDLAEVSTIQWNKQFVQTLQRTAKRENKTELDVHHDILQPFIQCITLFDDRFKLQAIRIQLKSSTSRTEETVLLPIKAIFADAGAV